MSTATYQNQDFVEQEHNRIQNKKQERQEQFEQATETREALESDPEQALPYENTPGRQIGTVVLNLEGEPYEFGKPSGRATKTMLRPITKMDEEGGSIDELSEYTWKLLADWSLNDDYTEDYWADEMSFVDAVQLARSVAMGGNFQNLRQ